MRISVLTFEKTRLPFVAQSAQPLAEREPAGAIDCLRLHWPEYLMEAAEVALYLFLTCVFAGLLLSPTSPVRRVIGSTVELRTLMGLAVGTTVTAIVLSPWGQQSGGHFNPVPTLSETRGFLKALIAADSDRILGFTTFGVGAGEIMSAVQIAMIAELPFTALRDAILTHPTLVEGLISLFSSVPAVRDAVNTTSTSAA